MAELVSRGSSSPAASPLNTVTAVQHHFEAEALPQRQPQRQSKESTNRQLRCFSKRLFTKILYRPLLYFLVVILLALRYSYDSFTESALAAQAASRLGTIAGIREGFEFYHVATTEYGNLCQYPATPGVSSSSANSKPTHGNLSRSGQCTGTWECMQLQAAHHILAANGTMPWLLPAMLTAHAVLCMAVLVSMLTCRRWYMHNRHAIHMACVLSMSAPCAAAWVSSQHTPATQLWGSMGLATMQLLHMLLMPWLGLPQRHAMLGMLLLAPTYIGMALMTSTDATASNSQNISNDGSSNIHTGVSGSPESSSGINSIDSCSASAAVGIVNAWWTFCAAACTHMMVTLLAAGLTLVWYWADLQSWTATTQVCAVWYSRHSSR